MDTLGSPLQISPRPDVNCRVMYGLDDRASSLVEPGLVLVQPNVTTSAELRPQGR